MTKEVVITQQDLHVVKTLDGKTTTTKKTKNQPKVQKFSTSEYSDT